MESGFGSDMMQAAPLPWNRFYFPDHQQATVKLMGSNSFFQFMDVYVPDLSTEETPKNLIVEGVPTWVK
eukprot:gene28330-35095_t